MRDATSFSAGLGSGSVCEQGVTILRVPPTGPLVSRGSCLWSVPDETRPGLMQPGSLRA